MSETPRHVHFIAIAGTGMASLAGLLHARGVEVTGSDDHLYPPMSTALESWGIAVERGFRAEHVLGRTPAPDLVVIGNAVGPDNPEARAAIAEGLPYLSFPDALHRLAIEGRHPVVVTGTHGKTTTTSLVAALLLGSGCDPSMLVGGFSLDFDGSFREGSGAHFVVEGDEYDTAFFDKTPKFLHYGARTAVITSVEFDHADIYRDLDQVKQAFRSFVAGMPADGTLVAAVDHAGVREVVADTACPVVGYGAVGDGTALWRAASLEVEAGGTSFDVLRGGQTVARARVPLFGDFNVENALAALVTAEVLGVPLDRSIPVLSTFLGVKRRQELRGEKGGVAVIDDFAHHPTAVRGSIQALRARFPGRRLIAVFEPRTNTSRRAVFQEEYARAFDGAHRVVLSTPPEGPIYSATGPVTDRFSSERLAADLRARGLEALALEGPDAIVTHLARTCGPGDVVLVMSNGDFGDVWQRLLDALG